jgi:hypothetical protein
VIQEKKKIKMSVLLSLHHDMRSVIEGGMLEKIPGADINDRVEVLEYVSTLPYSERIALLMGGLQAGLTLDNTTLRGGADCAESEEVVSAQTDIDSAKERIKNAVLDNSNAHEEFVRAQASSEALQAERDRLNEAIVEKTREMKKHVLDELLSNKNLAEANKELAAATIRKSEKEKKCEFEKAQEVLRKAEEERRRRESEAAEARLQAEREREEAQAAAEQERQAAIEEAENSRMRAVAEADRLRQIAVDEAAATAALASEQADQEIQAAKDAEEATKTLVTAQLQAQDEDQDEEVAVVVDGVVDTLPAVPIESCPAVSQDIETIQLVASQSAEITSQSAEITLQNAEIERLRSELEDTNRKTATLSAWTVQWKDRYNELQRLKGLPEFQEDPVTLEGGSRARVDKEFRWRMNDLILKESTALKNKLEAMYSQKLEELKVYVSAIPNLTDLQKDEINAIFEEYEKETQKENAWFPQVKLYAGYMKQSFEDFLTNSDVDFSNNADVLQGGDGEGGVEGEGGEGKGVGGGVEGGESVNEMEERRKSNALYELEKCLSRIQTFAERKANQVVKNCADSYNARVAKYDGGN